MAAKERVENESDGYKNKNKLLLFASLWQLGRTSKDLFASSRKHFLHTHSIVEIVPIPIYFPPQPSAARCFTTSSLLILVLIIFRPKNNSLTKQSSFTLPAPFTQRRHHGSHQANRPQIHRRQGPPQAGKVTTTATTTTTRKWSHGPMALRRHRPRWPMEYVTVAVVLFGGAMVFFALKFQP